MPDHRLPRGLEHVRLLGSGGFGYVVLARDPNLGREVAVKYVYGAAQVGDGKERMAREARAMAALEHPGILRVYELVDVGVDLAMIVEYAAGGDLMAALAAGHLDLAQRLDVLDQVADALGAAHRIGIVHRDLKPPNILLTRDGRVRIADFGLARLTADAASFRTDAGVVIGTPHYAPPEQLAGTGLESPRIDWYSFAVLAHVLLVGAVPLPGRAEPEFAQALAVDPGRRVPPHELLARLRAVPAHRWPLAGQPRPGVAGDDVATGSDPDPDATSAAPATISPWGRGAAVPVLDADATTVAPRPERWVDVPVFAADRVPRWRRLVPLLLGLGLGAAVAAVIVLVGLAR